jgi:hypothetical protein
MGSSISTPGAYHGDRLYPLIGARHGQGVNTYPDGSIYEGAWQHDKRHGRGIMIYSNGSRYEGNYESDVKCGLGNIVFADGSRYQGMWKAGNRHGRGKHVYCDYSEFEGEWRNDRVDGFGVYKWKDGWRFQGKFHEVEGILYMEQEGMFERNGFKSISSFSVFKGLNLEYAQLVECRIAKLVLDEYLEEEKLKLVCLRTNKRRLDLDEEKNMLKMFGGDDEESKEALRLMKKIKLAKLRHEFSEIDNGDLDELDQDGHEDDDVIDIE